MIYDGSSSKPMTPREKEREDGNTKMWIPWEQKEIFRWNREHISYFLRGYDLVKK